MPSKFASDAAALHYPVVLDPVVLDPSVMPPGDVAAGAVCKYEPSEQCGRAGHDIAGHDIDVLVKVSDIERIAADWIDLEKRSAAPAFFQSSGWCRHIMRELGASSAIGDRAYPFEFIVATARDEGRLIAIWPLAVSRLLGGRFLTSLGAPFDQYGEILVERDGDIDAIAAGFVARLREEPGIDGLMVRKVRAGGPMEHLAALGATLADEASAAPWLSFEPGQSFEDFHKRINSKTRKNLRNLNNRLAKLGHVEHRVLSGDEIPPALRLSFERRQDWLAAQGLSSTAFRDGRFRAVVEGLARPEAHFPGLTVFALYLDEKIIALQWGFIHQNRYYAFLSAKDQAYDEFSVGRIHLEHVLRACHGLGVRDVDLLVPAVPYKMTWADEAASVRDAYWGWTLRGRVILELFVVRVRPTLKKAIARLPEGLRRLVFRAAFGQH